VCGAYIPPYNSNYFCPDLFDELENDIEKFSSLGSVLLMEDLNSRTGKYSDIVCQEGNTIITNDQSESSLCAIRRNSFDNELNNHGKRLLEICRSADLKILNGRTSGHSLGRPTFHGKSGVSIVDYAIFDQHLFRHIANFIVRSLGNCRGSRVESTKSRVETHKSRVYENRRVDNLSICLPN